MSMTGVASEADFRAPPRQSLLRARGRRLRSDMLISQSFTSQSCLFKSRAVLAAQTPTTQSFERRVIIPRHSCPRQTKCVANVRLSLERRQISWRLQHEVAQDDAHIRDISRQEREQLNGRMSLRLYHRARPYQTSGNERLFGNPRFYGHCIPQELFQRHQPSGMAI